MNPNKTIEQRKETYRAGLPKADPAWPAKIRQAIILIHAWLFAQKLTVMWIEEQCYVQNHNFSTTFAYYVGQTPKKYILHHRIAVAKKLLSNAKLNHIPISAIAFELGFSSASAFPRLFKRKCGMSPGGWRKEKADR